MWRSDPLLWKWDLSISREVLFCLSGNGMRQMKELEEILEEIHIWHNVQDSIKWWPEQDGSFSVKSCYDRCRISFQLNNVLQEDELQMLKSIWKARTPSKIQVFGWRIIMNKLPSKDQLVKRGVIQNGNRECLLCSSEEKICLHLFFSAGIARWYGVKLESGLDYRGRNVCLITTAI